jgi:hypothetical protein
MSSTSSSSGTPRFDRIAAPPSTHDDLVARLPAERVAHQLRDRDPTPRREPDPEAALTLGVASHAGHLAARERDEPHTNTSVW